MDNPVVVAAITVAVAVGLSIVFLLMAAGGSAQRIRVALASFWKALVNPRVYRAGRATPDRAANAPTRQGRPACRCVSWRSCQRDGRLVDFLLEDVQAYPDAQIGAAVRDIHRKCQAALKEHLVLEPVLNQQEGATVEVPPGFDPSAVRLTGNVTGQPPFRGVLQQSRLARARDQACPHRRKDRTSWS